MNTPTLLTPLYSFPALPPRSLDKKNKIPPEFTAVLQTTRLTTIRFDFFSEVMNC
jgi:hypothetical protein